MSSCLFCKTIGPHIVNVREELNTKRRKKQTKKPKVAIPATKVGHSEGFSWREIRSAQPVAKEQSETPIEIIHSSVHNNESTSACSGDKLFCALLRLKWRTMFWSTRTHPCPLNASFRCQDASNWQTFRLGERWEGTASGGEYSEIDSFEFACLQTFASWITKSRVSCRGSIMFSKINRLQFFQIYHSIWKDFKNIFCYIKFFPSPE